MILFLDFDGVTYPEFCDPVGYFCRLPAIEAVLREYPHVEIVVSSTWRLDFDDEAESTIQMRKHFSFDIASRVVGVTPDIRSPEQKKAPRTWVTGLRERECLAWLQHYRIAGTPWIALDDTQACISEDRTQVMIVDGATGFLSEHEDEFGRRLRSS